LLSLVLTLTMVACDQPASEVTQVDTTTSSESAAPQEDWEKFEGKGVTLYLPPSYVGGNPDTDFEEIEEALIGIDPQYEERLGQLKENAGAIALLAFDTENAQSGFPTNINVTNTQAEGATLDQFTEAITAQLSQVFTLEAPEKVEIKDYPAAKINATVEAPDATIQQLFYIIQEGSDSSTFWIVTYATTQEQFAEQVPEFEQSIETFTLTQPADSSSEPIDESSESNKSS
jgi:hypothetical protein